MRGAGLGGSAPGRVGEASHLGPAASGTPVGGERQRRSLRSTPRRAPRGARGQHDGNNLSS
eukprot:12362678-Karenia_brevis.AAC.1